MVCRFANGLRKLGIKKGDRVAIYMPMIVELPVAMLACARIGAAHSVIFGGFAPDAIVDRVNDSECVALITADQGWRRGKHVPLKANCDEAIAKGMPSLKHVIVAKRVGAPVEMVAGRDHWWDDVVRDQPSTCEPERMNAEDLLFLLYTSGTTAKPKGIKHTTGGYLTQRHRDAQARLRPQGDDRRLLVRGRHRLGDGSFVHRLRPALQRRDQRALRRHARLPRQGPAVGHRRALQGHDSLHSADCDPHLHEMGHALRRKARHDVAAAVGFSRRTDQSGSLDVVPHPHRRRALSGRRHVVANGDRRAS